MSVLEVPTRLPVEHLSVSAVNTYLRCPIRWKHRYIDREYEPPSGQMILGSSVGAAEGHAYQAQIDEGERPPTEHVLDLFSDEWDDRTSRETVDWGNSDPGTLKDHGVALVGAYDQHIAPTITPTSVERPFTLTFDDVDWDFTGFFDVEDDTDTVIDLKVKAKRLSPAEALVDLQPTAYLLARRAEGNPAQAFKYHTMIRTKAPTVEVVPTVRTDQQLDAFTRRLFVIAAEINWRLEHDIWNGAVPGTWWCGERFCGYWDSCEFGGLR